MSKIASKFEPGVILYEVVLGAFKARGTPFEAWCKDNKTSSAAARSALKGVNSGASGQLLIQRLIKGAGIEVVEVAYRHRMEAHVASFRSKSASSNGGVAA